jgi:type VI secretion system protein ImpB
MARKKEEEMFVDLTFSSMGDFAPDKIAMQVPQLAELMKMRKQLEELLGFMDGRIDAEKRIAKLLSNDALLTQIAGQAINDGDKE